MNIAIDRLMEWRKLLLKNGRLEDLARQYIFPMAIYSGSGMRPIASPDQLIDVFRDFVDSLTIADLAHLDSRVTMVELPVKGRFRVWSEWLVNRPGNAPRVIGKSVHFMRETEHGTMTEMLECIHPTAESSVAARKA